MSSRSSLPLMEQCVMLLVFALAAALCLKAFLFAHTGAQENARLTQAVTAAQNAAELLKYTGGDPTDSPHFSGTIDDGCWTINYDENWRVTTSDAAFTLTARYENASVPGLGQALITVTGPDGESIFSIPAAWQEVSSGG